MIIKKKETIVKITIELNQEECRNLNDLILFAFDYEKLKPNSLYTSEKEFGRKLSNELEKIGCDSNEE